MTDQAQRLEIATVRAEIGSNITYRFNNDEIDAGGIPTESGDIKNLKLIIKEIEDKASVSSSIYATVAEGLSATAEGGMFLVQSDEDDEIYAVWRKVGGVAVDTGKRALSSQAAEDAVNAAQSSADASAASATIAQAAADSAEAEFQGLSLPDGATHVVNGAETVAAALDRAGEQNEFAWGNVKQNTEDFASFGPNLAPALSGFTKVGFDASGVHASGTSGSLTAAIAIPEFSQFKLTVTVTTTTPGNIQFKLDAADVFDDTPEGYYFSNAAILADGIEQDRVLTNTVYTFLAWTYGVARSQLSAVTDTAWAGTISSIEFSEVAPTKFSVAGCGADANGPKNPIGLKVVGYNRNDMAIGDKLTLGMFYNDGQPLMGAHNVAMGARSLGSMVFGGANTALGSFVLQYNEGTGNVSTGYSCFKLNTKGQENTGTGYKCGFYNTTGYRNTYSGFWAGALNRTGYENTAHGWYAGRNATGGSTNTYLGSRSGQSNIDGSNNTFLGAFAGYGTGSAIISHSNVLCIAPESLVYGDNGVAMGFQAKVGASGALNIGGVATGRNARATGSDGSIAHGLDALASGGRSISLGQGSKAVGVQSVACGALAEANADNTTSLGAQAGRNNTGAGNTFVGQLSGNLGANSFSNCSLLGKGAVVTGSNQVQLGDSATTTYVYGTVQNRSDSRDKINIQETELGIDFVMGLRPVSGRWDLREDYRVVNEDGTVTVFEKDGSRSRKRKHQWFVAQEVQELCDKMGVEFGGIQHHALNGGDDVYSLGYDEFIPPVVKAVQQCWSRIDDLERRIAALEVK